MKRSFGFALAASLLLFDMAPASILASNSFQQATTPKDDIKDAGTSTKNAAKKTGSATKK